MKRMLIVIFMVMLAVKVGSLAAHPVTVDGDPSDWTGTPPGVDEFTYSDYEAIWHDAADDDLGDGGDAPGAADNPEPYSYPLNSYFLGTEADIIEWRMTACPDSSMLYFLIRINNFDQVWMPFIGIALDLDHIPGSGQMHLGGYASLTVDPMIYWEYIILLFDDSVVVMDVDWNHLPVNYEVVFDTANNVIEAGIDVSTWDINPFDLNEIYVVVYSALQDYGNTRGVDSVASEWQGGGGTDSIYDPNVYDLCFVPADEQHFDLDNYTDSTFSTVRASSAQRILMSFTYVSEGDRSRSRPQKASLSVPVAVRGGLTLKFTLPKPSKVKLSMFTASGRRVATLIDGYYDAGTHEVFVPHNLRSGIYFIRLESDSSVLTEKVAVVR